MKKHTSVQNVLDLTFEENSILHGIIKGGKDNFAETLDILTDRSFNNLPAKIIYGVCKDLFDSNQDITVPNILSNGQSKGLAPNDISPVLDTLPVDLKGARQLATKLKNRLIIKESINSHRDAINKLSQMSATESTGDIFSVSESTLFDLVSKFSNVNDGVIHLKDVTRDLVTYWGTNPSENVGIPTPWPKFNKSIGGGMRTGVTLIGARSGQGKTNLALITANYVSSLGVPVLILDTEMEYKDVLPRLLSNISEVGITRIETGAFVQSDFELKAINGAVTQIENSSIYYKTVAGKSFDEILSTIRRWIYTSVGLNSVGRANHCLVIYDYFKIMDSGDISDMQEYQAMGFQISKLTDFCKMYDFPCLSFVQLNRDGVAKEGTDVIAQSDRLLWLCNSFSIFKSKSTEEMESSGWNNGNRKMITLKSRYGGECAYGEYIPMQFKGDICSLKEVTEKVNNDGSDEY